MKLHVLQHVPFEGPAAIEIWAKRKNNQISVTNLFQNESFPDLNQFDLLVVMGGPMNIYEEREYPWLTHEKRFIEKSISGGKSVLGVCLGAQLIADVLGAPVSRNQQKEIGWYEIELAKDAAKSACLKDLPKKSTAFHWHGDTFQIPKGAVLLASSQACQNQAFEFNRRVLALQFHLESTEKSIEKLIQNCGDELVQGPFIQTADQIRSGFKRLAEINSMMFQVLDKFQNQIVTAA